MFTHEQIEAMPERIYKRLRDINTQYLEILGKRIAEVGEIIPTDVYKLQRIFESGVDIKEIETALSKANRMNIQEIESLFDDVAEEGYNFYEPFYAYRKKRFIPYADNEPLQKQIEAMKRITVDEYKNLTQTTGFLVYDKNGKIPTKFGELKAVPTTLSKTYNITLDNAVQAINMGAADYQSAMRRVIRALADSGIKTVDYASGYSRRLDTSVRQNILWGIKQCNQEIADMVGEEIGADGYEISYHSNPRPSHADMGGRLYAKGEGRTIKGVYYPSIDTVQPLLDEYGCLHFKFSVILGLSEPTYSKKALEKLKAKDNKPITFEGKEITKYEASQKQSTLETAMRHCDDRLTIAKAADNEILILKETERMRQLQNKYNELSKASGLPTKWERTVSGLKTSKKPLTKGGGGGIMRVVESAANSSVRNTGRILKYNPNKDFSITIAEYTNEVNVGLSKATAKVAKIGGETGKECLVLVDLASGEHEYFELGVDGSSVGDQRFWKFISENANKKFAFVHNHNTDGYFSETDMRTLLTSPNIDMFVATRIDGVTYVAQNNVKYFGDGNFDKLYFDELEKTNRMSRIGMITPAERTHKREEIIVDNLLKDYTKGLEEFEDGKRLG